MVVDSSVWIEIVCDGPLRKKCEEALKNTDPIVPTLVIYEIYRKLKKQTSEETSLEVVSALSKYKSMEINRDIALLAGDLSLEFDLGMADSMVLACARFSHAQLLTLDNDFASVTGVKVIR
ncbi:type II toxin-antitoxin system VapC family toxin [Bdellovibrio sp. HCB-162]|uniref:type II toxin-antitoxin system VapC family toxin n=1 Tax=Bdellovibrio sp. HCB-162 TaxID=3394234 RepID=UPI0039BD0FA4